jgi:hypothetical protein
VTIGAMASSASAIVLAALAALHLYWAAGGEYGIADTVPSRSGGTTSDTSASSNACATHALLAATRYSTPRCASFSQ